MPAIFDAGVTGGAGRRLVAVYYTVNLVVTCLVALALVLTGVLWVVGGDAVGWLAVVLGPAVCLAWLLRVRLAAELAVARFDIRADLRELRDHHTG
ncbi:uncharacterized protein DUF4282 [Stackebrandtia albiflava]|uniref:Uncharacterized protein DUF4282 n=2 Tax=Stackebrandtia albiflava TaxID=406432 RepID=A0A562UYA6_9ACTN|nr:uncharacterized protein DUF4282 [Stackebrandtia albiflava]